MWRFIDPRDLKARANYFLIVVLGGLAPLLSGFLVAPIWARYVSIPAGIIAFLWTCWFVDVVVRTRSENSKLTAMTARRLSVSIFAIFVLHFWMAFTMIFALPPLVTALVVREDVAITYQIANVSRSSRSHRRWGCSGSVTVAELPPMANFLCGVSFGFRMGLREGGTIVISGKGSELGLFSHTVSRGPASN